MLYAPKSVFYLLFMFMFPTLHLRGLPISMTGLGIVAFRLVFIVVARKNCKRLGLPFRELFRRLPTLIIISYLLGTWTRYALEHFVFFPLSPQRLLLYLSPYEFHFHFVGVITGLIIGRKRFLKSQPRERHLARHTVVFEGVMMACLPLGIFLLFGDHFIGKPIESGIYISAIDATSKMAAYDTVIPLGIYVSVLAGTVYLITTLLYTYVRQKYRIFLGFALFFFGLGLLLMRQIYPRHLVMKVGSLTLDIKQYLSFGVAIFCLRQHVKFWSFVSRTSTLHETDVHV